MRARPTAAQSSAAAHTDLCDFGVSLRAAEPSAVRRDVMSKGMDRKKETKKKPAKTLEEKRAAKREKKANKR